MATNKKRFEVIFTQDNGCDAFHILLDNETGQSYLWIVSEHGMGVAVMAEDASVQQP